ncbi:copper resistance protein CopC, partial [Dietzia sp. DQ12-76]|uniref:copper resistance protein CopC n=1 Tax=Dietzia sp. DQ12-76 TaxID=1630639 RepID=UPI0015FAEA65
MSGVRTRWTSGVLAAAVIAGGAAVPATVLVPVAAAHSVLVSVEPEDGATLDASPDQVALTFNEEINQ